MSPPPPPYSWRAEGGYLSRQPEPTPPCNAYIAAGQGAFLGMGYGPVPPMPPMPPMPMFPGMAVMPPMPPMPMFPGMPQMPPMPPMPTFPMLPMPPPPPPFMGYQTPDPAKGGEPKKDDSKKDEPKKDEPKKDEPKKDEPKKDEPKKDEPKKDDAKKDEPKVPGLSLPSGLPAGHSFLYNSHYTSLHIITTPDVKPWDTPGADFSFNIFKADCDWSVAKLLDRLGKKADDMVVTECVEIGQGKWTKGTSVEGKGDKGKMTLRACGWDEKRGADRPPVWLVVHKA